MKWLILVIAALWFFIAQLQKRYRLLQYAFLLRFPLLHVLLLLALPWASRTDEFHTLFVLDPRSMLVATALILFSAMTAIYTLHVLFIAAPVRFSLRWDQPPKLPATHWDDAPRANVPLVGPLARTYAWPLLLAAPTLAVILYASRPHDLVNGLAVASGIAAVWLVRAIAVWVAVRLRAWVMTPLRSVPTTQVIKPRHRIAVRLHHAMGGSLGRAVSPPDRNMLSSGDLVEDGRGHGEASPVAWGAFGFACLALVVYAVGAFALSPLRTGSLVAHTPAIAYLALMMVIFGLLVPAISFYTDFYRVPLMLAVVAYLMVSYALVKREHLYYLKPLSSDATEAPQAMKVMRNWVTKKTQPTLVVVAVSGGGSPSALWTTTMLTSIAGDRDLRGRFVPSIAMMSVVSGGALGAAYVVDRLENADLGGCADEPPSCGSSAVEASRQSHVGALSWGIVYPDAVRLVYPSLFKGQDRGWALEQSWRRGFASASEPTLQSWAADAENGLRPIVVFNATAMETGQRMLISRVELPSSASLQFARLYPGMDLPIATAVRLSASYPYLAPRVRPASPNPPRFTAASPGKRSRREEDPFEKIAFHLADGGYHDNSGVVTAAEFVDALVAERLPQVKRILFLQLKTVEKPKTDAKDDDSWGTSVFGPPAAQLSSAIAAQHDRASAAIDAAMHHAQENCIEARPFTFWLKKGGTLPWHLSDDEQTEIRQAAAEELQSSVFREMKAFFMSGQGAPALPDACQGSNGTVDGSGPQ